MKHLLHICVIIFLIISSSNAQFVRKWEKSAALGNLPSWFSTTSGLQRGIAFTWDWSAKLLVITDAAVPTVIILDALTGDSVGALNTTGISGGLLALSDISAVSGLFVYPGIYACNLTENAASDPFKIYMWEDLNSAPQLVVIDTVSNFRLGDRLNVSDEFIWPPKRHLTTGSSGSDKIMDFISDNSNPPFLRNAINLSDGSQGNNLSAFFDTYLYYNSGGYIVNSDNRLPRVYNTTGSLQSVSPDSAISPTTNSIKFFINLLIDKSVNISNFYVTYNYSGKYADLVLNHLENMEDLWGHTPSMGNNTSVNNFGDVEYSWLANDSLYIFVLAGNNGIGAYHAYGCYLPVELVSFTAETNNAGILLKWITATEVNNKGFEIERTSPQPSPSEGEGAEWRVIGFVQGNGTTTEQTSYSFEDSELKYGIYKYRLKQIDYDGSFEFSDIVEVTVGLPQEYVLMQNYPNPFNPTTRIKYSIAEEGLVNLSVYNLLGQKISELENDVLQRGYYETEFDASSLSSGVYVYKLIAGGKVISRKMVVLK